MSNIELVFLGTAQDGSIPHANCECSTCESAHKNPEKIRLASSLMIVDKVSEKWFLIDATPDFTKQLYNAKNHIGYDNLMDGIFLTHGHIGHYTGIMYLGKESMDTKNIDLYLGEQLNESLKNSIPFSFLYQNKNVCETIIKDQQEVKLTDDLTITPIDVPHRNEVGETFGFKIKTPERTALFIPDIDAYEQMDIPILELLKDVDLLIIDATFYKKEELEIRDFSKIPHPTIEESLELFKGVDNCKIMYTHFNHTNMIFKDEDLYKKVDNSGITIANDNQIVNLSKL